MERVKYRIIYTEEVLKEKLPGLPKTALTMIKKAISTKLEMAPLEFGKPLLHNWKGYRRLRVADYRIIYRVEEEKVLVYIVEIDHRKDVYD